MVGSFKNHLPGQQGLTFCFAVVCSVTRINKHSLALGLPFTFQGPWLCHNLFESHPRTPGDTCVMAGPWHSPCPHRCQELQGSRTGAWSGSWCWEWTKGKRVRVQFRLFWSMFLAGISGELLPLRLFLPWPRNVQALGLSQSLCPGRQAHQPPGTMHVCREPVGDAMG